MELAFGPQTVLSPKGLAYKQRRFKKKLPFAMLFYGTQVRR